MDLLLWLESLAVSTWVRESASLLAYPGVLFLHTLGLGILVGANTAVALVVLRRSFDPASAALASFFTYMWLGFWINAGTGVLLVLADATTKLINPVFYIKIGFVVLAVVNMKHLRRQVTASASVSPSRTFAVLSLVLWIGAITAGRLLAYIGPVSGMY
jgi:hypothetical protein